MNTRPYTLVLLSAEQADKNEQENKEATAKLHMILHKTYTNVLPIEGSYKNHIEKSFAVFLYKDVPVQINILAKTAAIFQQEFILVVDTANKTYLQYLYDNRTEEIGYWTEISSKQLPMSWSKIDNRYFTTIKPRNKIHRNKIDNIKHYDELTETEQKRALEVCVENLRIPPQC